MFRFRDRIARVRKSPFARIRQFERLEERIALSGVPPTVAGVTVTSTQWSPGYLAYLQTSNLGTGGYSIPVGSNNQSTALSWNNIDQIKIKFSEDVNIQASDLSVTGKNAISYSFSSFYYDQVIATGIWTLSAPLAKDRFLIDLDANGIHPVKDLDGNVLDGEWSNNSDTYALAGNGTAGGDFEFLFNVLPGEVNATTQVTSLDYTYTRGQEGKSTQSAGYNFKYDIDGSGLIDTADWQFVQSKIGNALPTGTPAGIGNDAPTAIPFQSVSISDAAVDSAIALWSHFGDSESGATGLTYSIAGNTAATLFDSVSINSATGALVLNAKSNVSGVATLTIAATDSAGITTRSTVAVGVNYVNQPPAITVNVPQSLTPTSWFISGTVSDDYDVTGLIVALSITVDARAVVYPDGTFQVVVYLAEGLGGPEFLQVTDAFGAPSSIAVLPLGIV